LIAPRSAGKGRFTPPWTGVPEHCRCLGRGDSAGGL